MDGWNGEKTFDRKRKKAKLKRGKKKGKEVEMVKKKIRGNVWLQKEDKWGGGGGGLILLFTSLQLYTINSDLKHT